VSTMKLDRILVPVDYSEPSKHAVEYAVWLAGQVGARVEVMHVAPRPVEYLPLDEWIWGEEREREDVEAKVREAADNALKEFLSGLSDAVRRKVTTRLEMGVPSKTIIAVLEKDPYDLVIMGTHGRQGAKHVLLGSTAERVIRARRCPVLTLQ